MVDGSSFKVSFSAPICMGNSKILIFCRARLSEPNKINIYFQTKTKQESKTFEGKRWTVSEWEKNFNEIIFQE